MLHLNLLSIYDKHDMMNIPYVGLYLFQKNSNGDYQWLFTSVYNEYVDV
jgi:hypothetical protein